MRIWQSIIALFERVLVMLHDCLFLIQNQMLLNLMKGVSLHLETLIRIGRRSFAIAQTPRRHQQLVLAGEGNVSMCDCSFFIMAKTFPWLCLRSPLCFSQAIDAYSFTDLSIFHICYVLNGYLAMSMFLITLKRWLDWSVMLQKV